MIYLLMATKLEAAPIIEGFGLKQLNGKAFPVFKNDDLVLILTGIGKVNAALATSFTINFYSPETIYNLGAAGATDETTTEGYIYPISETLDLDRPRFKSGDPHRFTPNAGNSSDQKILGSRDRPALHPEDRKELSKIVQLVDMEGSAIVQTCNHYDVPCVLFKQVTDTPDHQTDKDIVKNIRRYRDDLRAFFQNQILDASQ